MEIKIYAASSSAKKDKTRKSGCAVMLVGVTKDGTKLTRSMGFKLGDATTNLASIQAARLALMSLDDEQYEKASVRLTVDTKYCFSMFENDGDKYLVNPKANSDAVKSLREWFERVHDLEVDYEKPSSGILGECAAMAQVAAVSQVSNDTGTMEHNDVEEEGEAGLPEED